MDSDKRVLTPLEAAKELGLCRKTIYTMLRNDEIPHVRCGDKWLIPVSAFEKWLIESYRPKCEAA